MLPKGTPWPLFLFPAFLEGVAQAHLHFPPTLLLLLVSVTNIAEAIRDQSVRLTVHFLLDFSKGIWSTGYVRMMLSTEDDHPNNVLD